MRKLIFIFLVFAFSFHIAAADTVVSGAISSDTTWSPNSGVYVIGPGVSVPAGVTLTIDPGTIVKFNIASGGLVIGLDIYGTLLVNGTDLEPVYFTSIRDDEIGGDTNGDSNSTSPTPTNWIGVTFRSGSTARINNSVVRYSGAFDGFYRSGVFNYGGEVSINKVSFENNFQTDIYQGSGSISVTESRFDYDNFAVVFDGGEFFFSQNSLDAGTAFINRSLTTIDARNNWWGDAGGPRVGNNESGALGAFISGGPVLYDPWLTEPPSDQAERNPVIIVPGIMGSAYKNDELVIDPILHTYDDLIATLAANGYVEGKDLFTFPYEWRDSNVFTANLLDGKIEQVKSICSCGKVDIVAHSMGGLVARAYIQSVDYDGDVDQIIFLGTPHRGSVIDYIKWEAGQFVPEFFDTLMGMFFQAESARQGYLTVFGYIRNRPILSVQELLPTFDYLKDKSTDIVRTYPNNYPRNFFLESLNSNISNLLNSGVEITNIIGDTGVNTAEKIRVIPSTTAGLWQHGEPEGFGAIPGDHGLENGAGDGTVTTFGATLDDSVSNENSITSHRRLSTVEENKVFNILTGKTATTNIDSGFEISPIVLLLQLKSPIDFVITAPGGKKIGKNFSNGAEYNEIPNAFYSGFETDNEYITILNPLDGKYKVEVQGTGNGGEYGILTSYVSDDASATKEVSGLTELNQVTTFNVVVNNDNPEEIEPEKVITSEVFLNDIIKAHELGWITDKKLKDNLVKKAQSIIKIEKKIEKVVEKLPDGKKKEKKVEKLETKIDKKAAKALLIELKGYGKGKINQQAYDIIKTDLEWLINN